MKCKIEIEVEAMNLAEVINVLTNFSGVNLVDGEKNLTSNEQVSIVKDTSSVEQFNGTNLGSDLIQDLAANTYTPAPASASPVTQTVLPTAEAEKYTIEQIAKGLTTLRDLKGLDEVKAILKQFNAVALAAVPEDKYNEIVAILNEKGVKV